MGCTAATREADLVKASYSCTFTKHYYDFRFYMYLTQKGVQGEMEELCSEFVQTTQVPSASLVFNAGRLTKFSR